jgi:cyclic beta-1,2-glucan synthetase
MYRAALEWILGFRVQGTALFVNPCIPKTWHGFTIRFHYRSAHYDISVENPCKVNRGIAGWWVDGVVQAACPPGSAGRVALADDGATHQVRVILGSSETAPASA